MSTSQIHQRFCFAGSLLKFSYDTEVCLFSRQTAQRPLSSRQLLNSAPDMQLRQSRFLYRIPDNLGFARFRCKKART